MKSLEVKFNEALAAIDKAGRRKIYNEKVQPSMALETKLNVAEAVLKDVGVVRTKESTPAIKHNGRSDNFVEGNPFNDGREFSAGYIKETTNPCEKGDKIMFDSWLKAGSITEAEHAKLTGAKPQGYDKLSESQRKEYDFARLIGINEADSFRVARLSR